MKIRYHVEDGALEFEFGLYRLYLNHPVIILGPKENEFEEIEHRLKLSLGCGIHYVSNSDLNYFYFGFMIFGFGFAISRQLM